MRCCNVVAILSMESVLTACSNCAVLEQCWFCVVCWSLIVMLRHGTSVDSGVTEFMDQRVTMGYK